MYDTIRHVISRQNMNCILRLYLSMEFQVLDKWSELVISGSLEPVLSIQPLTSETETDGKSAQSV